MKVSCASPLLDRATSVIEAFPWLERIVAKHWPAARLEALDVPRVMPRASGEILIQYRLKNEKESGSGFVPNVLYGEHFADAMIVPSIPDGGACTEWIPELRTRIWIFPSDPQLDRLDLLFDSLKFHKEYDEIMENVGYDRVEMGTPGEILGYRLGRRCVANIRWRPKEGHPPPQSYKSDLVVKMSRPRNALTLWTHCRQLEHEGFIHNTPDQISIPKTLCLHRATGAIFQQFEAGETVHDLVGSSQVISGCMAAGRALRKLHSTKLPGLDVHTSDDELRHLAWSVSVTSAAFPALRDALELSLTDLTRERPSLDSHELTSAHRDYYDKQVMVRQDLILLLDWDTLALADPALDYGNFIAHLQWRTHQAPEQSSALRDAATAFEQGYGPTNEMFIRRLRWWTAAALLRLTCLYAWRPRWRQQVPALLRSRRLQKRTPVT